MGVTKSWGGYPLDPQAVASPCGLQAKLYFRDTFDIFSPNSSAVPIRRDNLINLFKREPNSEKTQWIDPTLESFQIWMATSVNPVL